MKLYEVKEGINVVDRKLYIVGIYDKFKGNVFINEEIFVLNKTEEFLPPVSLEFARNYTEKEEILASYKLLKPRYLKEGDTIRSDENLILVIDETDDDWDGLDTIIFQRAFQADDYGKIDFSGWLLGLASDDIAYQFYSLKCVIIPESTVRIERLSFENYDMTGYYPLTLYSPTYHLFPGHYFGSDVRFIFRANTSPNSKVYLIVELFRDTLLKFHTAFKEDIVRFLYESVFRHQIRSISTK